MSDGWIPVGQRLPRPEDSVLVAVPGAAQAGVGYCDERRDWRWLSSGMQMVAPPTHWMPMPPLPWEGGVEDEQGPQPEPAPAAYSKEFNRGVEYAKALMDLHLAPTLKRLAELESRLAVLEARQPVTYPSWPPSPYRFTCGPAVSENKAA